MKKYIPLYSIVLCISFMAVSDFKVLSQTPAYCMTSPEGFGAGTTGGGTPSIANTIIVTTASGLSAALTGPQSVILISGTISTSRIETVITNKTIIGLPGARLVNNNQTTSGSGILYIKSGSKNVIIRNLIFEGPGAYDCDGWDLLTNKGCNNLWVDHCEFQDGVDDCFDNSVTSDNITVSWCKFTYLKPPKAGGSGGSNDHRFANLIGGGDSDYPNDGHYSITWQNCWWASGVVERMVRARNAELHLVNCYWDSQNAKYAISLTGGDKGSTCYVENVVFASTGKYTVIDGVQSMSMKLVNCTSSAGAITAPSLTGGAMNASTAIKPAYAYTIIPTDQVVATVTNAACGAGATLLVTSEGVVSSSFGLSAISQYQESKISCYPSLIDKTLNIDFPEAGNGNTSINIYSVNGPNVLSTTKRINAQQTVVLDLEKLNSGVYFINIRDDYSMTTRRFIKK